LTIKRLVLVGASPAHLQIVAAFKAAPRADTDVILVTPLDYAVHSTLLSGMVSGQHDPAQCTVLLEDLVKGSTIKTVRAQCTGIDTATRQVRLSSGHAMHYDVLSLDTHPVVDRDAIDTQVPGAKQYAMFTQPPEQFAKLWPQVLAHAAQKALHISVLGAGAQGVELAMALQHRLPTCRVTLITGPAAPVAAHPLGLQRRVMAALKARNITVLKDSCSTIEETCLHLSSGASLLCDIPVVAIDGHPPAYLADSGLALNDDGSLRINPYHQSTSHSHVFTDTSACGFEAGAAFNANIRAVLDDKPPKSAVPARHALNLISCGPRKVIASWGAIHFPSALAWRMHAVINQRWIRQYTT
jgi:NADH dehydrogenase FAD-containing subunit